MITQNTQPEEQKTKVSPLEVFRYYGKKSILNFKDFARGYAAEQLTSTLGNYGRRIVSNHNLSRKFDILTDASHGKFVGGIQDFLTFVGAGVYLCGLHNHLTEAAITVAAAKLATRAGVSLVSWYNHEKEDLIKRGGIVDPSWNRYL